MKNNKPKYFFFLVATILLGNAYADEESPSRISDEAIPLQLETFPERPSPILELGDPFFDHGKISQGYLLPTGAVWQPSFVMWGDIRNAVQTVDPSLDKSDNRTSEVASRVDLFGNLSLTSTERILIGVRPVDQDGRFTRYTLDNPSGDTHEDRGFHDEFNFEPTLLFFEGDFGELFPILDPRDQYGLDFGFSVGRQTIAWQDGMLINDRIDSIGISKINLKPSMAVNYRSTLLYAWNELNRNRLLKKDSSSSLFGWSNEIDFKETTAEFDIVYVDGDLESGDGIFSGLGFTHRLYSFNHTFRVLGSHGLGEGTDNNQDGALLFNELSMDLEGTHDYVYLDSFYGIDQFRSASRAPEFGGPLGGTGVLFASLGLGRYGAALNNQADDAFGSALGYQIFFNDRRQQILVEVGGRYAVEDIGQRAVASGVSFQTAVGQRNVLRFDTFTRYGDERLKAGTSQDNAFGVGARLEWMLRL
jgi:hypothetical protein